MSRRLLEDTVQTELFVNVADAAVFIDVLNCFMQMRLTADPTFGYVLAVLKSNELFRC